MQKPIKGYGKTITINNAHISYDDVGKGEIPIIFLHGFPFDRSMWKGQVNYLKLAYRLISVDLRGFGQSSLGKEDINIDLFSDDLIKLMDALKIEKAILCGLSMGGYIALNVINRFPGRFVGLILCDTNCIADNKKMREHRYKTIYQIEAHGKADFAEEFIENAFRRDSFVLKKEIVKKIEATILANTAKVITEGLKALTNRTETCSTLSSISVPTLIICGRNDKLTPVEQSEFLNRHIPRSKLRIIERAGHLSNLEQSDVFNEHLLHFLQVNAAKFKAKKS
jgi:pimeloyl-ACP methyl ester carboxylesterase